MSGLKFILIFIILTCSCNKARLDNRGSLAVNKGATAFLNVDINNPINKEITIKRLRVLSFNTQTKELISNNLKENIPTVFNYKVKVLDGDNNIHVICNETTDLTILLDGIKKETDFDKIKIYEITGALPLIMYGSKKGVSVTVNKDSEDAFVNLPGGGTTNVIEVPVDPLAVKLSMTFIKDIPTGDDDFLIKNIHVHVKQTPKYSSFPEETAYTGASWQGDFIVDDNGVVLSNNGSYIKQGDDFIIPEGVDNVILDNVYIPEHILQTKNDKASATYLMIYAECTNKATSQVYKATYRLTLEHAILNHNLYRNMHYKIYATIKNIGGIGFYAEIVPMKIKEISINWKPPKGLVIVSDLAVDYGKNKNIWNLYQQYSGILKISDQTSYKDVLFKYGSVVGITNNDVDIAFSPIENVAWKPITFNSSLNSWANIPYISSGSFITENTIENIKKGIGDPCRLVSLTDKQITEGIVDNKLWRMATPDEHRRLMNAKNLIKIDNKGLNALHYYLIPNVKTRTESGGINTTVDVGKYWSSSDLLSFQFSISVSNSADIINDNPQKAFAIRCVRTEGLPPSKFNAIGSTVSYKGGIANISVTQKNVPYWSVEYVSGDLTALGNITNLEGSFDGRVSISVSALIDPYTPRLFTFKIKGYGLDGVNYEDIITIKQDIITHLLTIEDIKPILNSHNGYFWVSQKGGTYVITTDLYPEPNILDYPAVSWVSSAQFSTGNIEVFGTVATPLNKKTTIIISENNTGDVRLIILTIAENGLLIPNGMKPVVMNILQEGK